MTRSINPSNSSGDHDSNSSDSGSNRIGFGI